MELSGLWWSEMRGCPMGLTNNQQGTKDLAVKPCELEGCKPCLCSTVLVLHGTSDGAAPHSSVDAVVFMAAEADTADQLIFAGESSLLSGLHRPLSSVSRSFSGSHLDLALHRWLAHGNP